MSENNDINNAPTVDDLFEGESDDSHLSSDFNGTNQDTESTRSMGNTGTPSNSDTTDTDSQTRAVTSKGSLSKPIRYAQSATKYVFFGVMTPALYIIGFVGGGLAWILPPALAAQAGQLLLDIWTENAYALDPTMKWVVTLGLTVAILGLLLLWAFVHEKLKEYA